MPREHKRKAGSRNYQNYTNQQLEKAVAVVTDGALTVTAAAKEYNIPYGTLFNKVKGKHSRKPGGQTALTQNEEICILMSAIKCSEWGFPLDTMDLRMITKGYLDKQCRVHPAFKNNLPGVDWALSFLKRHKDKITQRMASNISRKRAEVDRNTYVRYFGNLKETLQGVPPENIFNYDESNLTDDPGKSRGIYRRGTKYPEKVMNHTKSATTIMVCGSASGVLLPPYIVFKSAHLWSTWCTGGPKGPPCCSKGSRYNRTPHGWMESICFDDWFHTVFLPHAQRLPGRKVLIGDNLQSHFNENVLSTCDEKEISFVCFPANSTHICQPLDVSFFRPLKGAWRKTLTNWKHAHLKSNSLPKEQFSVIFKDTLDLMDKSKVQQGSSVPDSSSAIKASLISGFRGTGIFPVNPEAVLTKLPGTSNNEQDPTEHINKSLINYLNEKRFLNASNGAQQAKKKKLNCEPGKSIQLGGETSESSVSDSESTESEIESDNDHQEVDYIEPTSQSVQVGRFILAKFLSGARKSITYRYVCIVEEVGTADDSGEIKVKGMKTVDNKHKICFAEVDGDISMIEMADIIAVLPTPRKETKTGTTVQYHFEHEVDVKEM